MKTLWITLLVLGGCSKDLSKPTRIHLYSSEYSEKVANASQIIQDTVNAPDFKSRVLSAKFTDTNDDNEDIYKAIKGHDVDAEVIFFYDWQGPVAKTNKHVIYYNSAYLYASDELIAGRLFHEIGHIDGYDHKNPSTLQTSVPVMLDKMINNEVL